MREGNVMNIFFVTRKDLQGMLFFNSVLDVCLASSGVYRLELNLLPIGYCKYDLLNSLICLQRNEFYFDGDLETIYGVIDSMLDIRVGQGEGYLLCGDGVVCHNIFIATFVKISN